MSRQPWLWPAIIVLSAAAVGVVALGGVSSPSPVRAVVAIWFLFVCPGMAFVRLLQIDDALTELSLAVALSLSLDALVAGAMLYAGVWSSPTALVVLIVISVAGSALQLSGALGPRFRRQSEPG